MSVPHHVHGFATAAEAAPLSSAQMTDTIVDLAKQAVRTAVEAGGDPAAGVLRLLLNELSPMPPPERISLIDQAVRESHARFVLGLALLRRNSGHARRLKAVAVALAPNITNEGE